MSRRPGPAVALALGLAGLMAGCSTPPASEPAPAALATPARFTPERRPWTYQGRPGRLLVTASVELYTTTDDPRLLMRLPGFLELAQAHRLRAVTPLRGPDTPLETYVLGTRAEWEAMTRSLLREHARAYLRIERGGYAALGRGIFYDLGPRDTFTMAAHEGWHQFVQTAFADPLPVWLDEGLACYTEGFRWRVTDPDRPEFLAWANEERFDQLRAAAGTGRLMGLDELVQARPQDLIDTDQGGQAALTYYAQCWALIQFLMESDGGRRRPGLERLLRDAQDGRFVSSVAGVDERAGSVLRTRRTGGGALAAYWPDESLAEMDAAYRDFVRHITRTGAKDLVTAGRSPV